MKAEFDYQWKNLPSQYIELNEDRINELLAFTGLSREYFNGKKVLDAGCGSGRYTYAMLQLGAIVDSIDVSEEAINKCRLINPKAKVLSLLEADGNYDFILSWGVLHHTENPRLGFDKLVSLLNSGGMIHIMVYRKENQIKYEGYRKIFHTLDEKGKLKLCAKLGKDNIHGWYDSLNPTYNWSYEEEEVTVWFNENGLKNINITTKRPYNININGIK